MSIKADNPIKENKTYAPLCHTKQCGRASVSEQEPLVDTKNPSAEGSEGSKVEWEAEQAQVYSAFGGYNWMERNPFSH